MDRRFARAARWFASVAALLVLAGCATPPSHGGYGGYPQDRGGYGYPDDAYRSPYGGTLTGTVEGLDPRSGRIAIVTEDARDGRMQRIDVRYDQRTRLWYQGREHAIDGLERGDVVRITGTESGRDFLADTIEVVHDVRDGGYGRDNGGGYGRDQGGPHGRDGYGRNGAYGEELRGTVAWVDGRAGLLRLDGTGYGGGYGSGVELAFDGYTTVEYEGRRYRPEDLERGDRVRVQARRVGGDRWLAERIFVERSVR